MSKASKHIRNLTELDKEIYRLKLEATKTEIRMDKNLEYFRENYIDLMMNSVFHRHDRSNETLKEKIADTIWNNSSLQAALDKVVNAVVDKAVTTAEKILHKK